MGKASNLSLEEKTRQLELIRVIDSKDSINLEDFIEKISKNHKNEVVLAIYQNDAPTLGYSFIEVDEYGVPPLDDIMAGVGYFDADKITMVHLNSKIKAKSDLNYEQNDFVEGLKEFFEEKNINYLGYFALQENNEEVSLIPLV